MKKIVISGAHSNIGKTSLAEDMLGNLPGWSALKITVNHVRGEASNVIKKKSNCPRQTNCHVCSDFKGEFDIVTDKSIINQKETDTGRLKEAGAKKVIWLRSTLKGLKAGLKKAFILLKGSKGIIIEGTSVLKHIKPDFTIYLSDKTTSLRTAAKKALKKADIVINVNR